MIVLNIQFWENDRDQAMKLARLIADLEPKKRDDIMLFTARFDCKHDFETIEYVKKKFDVLIHTTKRKATGWPNGPNQMMGDSYEFCVEHFRRMRRNDVEAVMMIESDCIPLHKNWINMLVAEFRASGKSVLGAWLKLGDANVEHINGNCLIALNFWRKFPSIFHPPSRGGWDVTLRHGILPNGHPSRLIWSDYQLGQEHNPWKGDDFLWEPKRYGALDNPLYGQELNPVWFHGIKIDAGIKAARKRLLNEQPD